MILGYDGFCFSQRCEPPLNLKIFIYSNAFDNSTLFDQQPKFTWLVCVSLPSPATSAMRVCGFFGGEAAMYSCSRSTLIFNERQFALVMNDLSY